MSGTRKLDGPVIVRKYGGSSLASIPHLRQIARSLRDAVARGQHLVVVVSAMGDQTDELVRLAHEANPQPPRREMDMLLTVGERISMSLLCMALAGEGVPAISLTGSQVGIITDASHTDARIREVKAYRIAEALADGKLVVVAGFQGFCAETREITTLGRGGSDTTAVALAHALGAERCEILKDVPGVMTADPKLIPAARLIERLSFEEMQSIADAGCGVVHPRAVAYAAGHGVPLYVGSSFVDGPGTIIGPPGGTEQVLGRNSGRTAHDQLEPDDPPPASWHPFVLTMATQQASLALHSQTSYGPPALCGLAERASFCRALTAEWLDCGAGHWHWEGWGSEKALAPIAAMAADLAAGADPSCRISWHPDCGVLTLAGRRTESLYGSLRDLLRLLQARQERPVRLRTDGQSVRLLGSEPLLRDLSTAIHDLMT